MERVRWVLGMGCAIGLALGNVQAADVSEPPIAAVQALLRQERLYSGPVNGVEDRATVAAIRRYQILHGLRATGRLDPETLRTMLLPAPAPRGELSASDQEILHELATTPFPDPVAETRKPIPPGEPPAVVASPTPAKANKTGRAKVSRQRRSGSSRLSAD